MEQKLTKEQLKERNQIWFKAWQDYKNRWTMRQIANMFNCPLPTFYQIIREQSLIDQKYGHKKKDNSL